LTASVDDARVLEYGQHLGRASECVVTLFPAGFERGDQIPTVIGGRGRPLGDLADNSQDRSLDRTLHRTISGSGSNGECLGPHLRIVSSSSTFSAHGVGKSTQDL